MRHMDLGNLGNVDLTRRPFMTDTIVTAGYKLFTYTYWPEDEAARSQYLAKLVGKSLATIERAGSGPEIRDRESASAWLSWNEAIVQTKRDLFSRLDALGGFQALVAGPSLQEADSLIGGLHRSVNIAGRILILARLIAAHRRGDTSINRAVNLLERHMEFHREEIFEAWTKYKSIAHISAANTLLNANPDAIPPELREATGGFSLFDGMGLLLKLASEFQDFGLTTKARAQRLPLLDPDRIWLVPPRLQLPEEKIWRDPVLSEEITRDIDSYSVRPA